MTRNLDTLAELIKLGYKFAQYISARIEILSAYHEGCGCDCSFDKFWQRATPELKERFENASMRSIESEKHLSDIQTRLHDLGYIRWADDP